MTVLFEDGNEVTGSMLVGTDGPQLSVRSRLVEFENAKPTPTDSATMIRAKQHSRVRALFLRSAPYQPFLQITSHTAITVSCDSTLLDLHDPESWTFTHYILFPEPQKLENKMTLASTSHIEKQWLLNSLTPGEVQSNECRITPRQRGMAN